MQQFRSKTIWPWFTILAVVIISVVELRLQGRAWTCSCGRFLLWVGDAWSSDTSQHLLDPYSVTHLLHGFLFCWLIVLAFPRLSKNWQLCLAVLAEAAWEAIENSNFIIERYRETTAALGYSGDTIVNSLGDILMCSLGFLIARWLRFKRSFAIFIIAEIILLFWIRDSLLLSILMLIYPIDEIKAWQSVQQ